MNDLRLLMNAIGDYPGSEYLHNKAAAERVLASEWLVQHDAALVAEVERLRAVVEAVRLAHANEEYWDYTTFGHLTPYKRTGCPECISDGPCKTLRAVEESFPLPQDAGNSNGAGS